MELNEEPVRYLTKAELEALKEQEHRERVALAQRVARGELTAEEANRAASMFKPGVFHPADAVTVNFDEVVDNLLKLQARKPNGRRKPKAVRS
jgi:hypothetical protein